MVYPRPRAAVRAFIRKMAGQQDECRCEFLLYFMPYFLELTEQFDRDDLYHGELSVACVSS